MGRRMTFRHGLVIGFGWLVMAYLVIPMLVVFPVSLTDQYYLSMPKDELSFAHYAKFFSGEDWLPSLLQSLVVGALAATLATILGTLCAIGCWRIATPAAEFVRLIMLTPIIVPAIVHALALYRVWIDLNLLDTYAGVVLAHTLIGIPYVVITVSASLANFDPKLEKAARSLGASLGQTVRHVIAPAILPGMLSGGVIAFAISFDDIVIVLFITSRQIFTLPKRIWNGIQDHLDPTVAVVASILIIATFAFVFAKLIVDRRRR